MELLTISRSKAARRCWRFHYNAYEIGRVVIKAGEALFFGTLFHVGLEQWWLCCQEFQNGSSPSFEACRNREDFQDWPLTMAITAMQAKFAGSEDADASLFDLVKAEELMRGYHFRWMKAMDSIYIIDVESQFEMPLINPVDGSESDDYRLGGKIDVRIRMRIRGELLCLTVEHKTSTEDITPGATYWTRLRMDGQVSQYTDGARSLGDVDVSGCLYDVAKRPTKKPKLMTPEEDQKWTQPKSCGECRENAHRLYKKHWLDTSHGSMKFKKLLVKYIPCTEGCEECEPPRLHSGQRLADETPDEFRIRVREDIADNPEQYYQRADVVRLEEELIEFRFDNWVLAETLLERQVAGRTMGKMAWPRNPDACFKWNRACEYYGACTGSASIDDDHIFRDKAGQHEELS